LLRPRNRLWSGSIAHHRDHLEVLVELDVVLLVLALGVIDFKVALPSVSFSILPPVQPGISRAALTFSASAGVTVCLRRESAVCKCSSERHQESAN
jgi:hypothetical protein